MLLTPGSHWRFLRIMDWVMIIDGGLIDIERQRNVHMARSSMADSIAMGEAFDARFCDIQ